MRHMDQPTTSTLPDYPRTPDGKYKYTTWDGQPLYYPSTKVPGVLKGPLLPAWLTKPFRRKSTRTAAR
jgi:hypothetical protein